MSKNMEKTAQIPFTGALTALLVVLQAATAPMGNTLVTGTLVNALLIVTVRSCGLWPGVFVSVLSPVMAKLVGIGPLWSLIPFIALGNTTLVLVWHFPGKALLGRKKLAAAISLTAGALAKAAVLYLGIVKLAVPMLELPQPQAAVISGMFSLPQLITALLGGIVALPICALLKKRR